ncbi:MAG: hypothetical protein LBP20_07445 [Treponema sp.]|jgi:hypothetical protein|nr:hypothetical protein [Treponema sp.]
MVIIRPDKFRVPWFRRFGIPAAAALAVLLAAAYFFSRPPALVVSDAGFDFVYGFRRTLAGQIGLSLRLFRRVERVLIAENADPDALAFAIEEKEQRPWAVLGHSRYAWGLGQYARQREDVRVVVIGEDSESSEPRPGPAAQGEAEFVFPDAGLNSWRLGRCAALLAGETAGIALVFQEQPNFPVRRDAFLAGLQEENENIVPYYLDSSSDYPSWDAVRCVVLAGPSESSFGGGREIPFLLYSWMDPALSPSSVKVVADDSPWALASGAFLAPPGGGYRVFPAAFSIPWGRVGDSGLRKKLKKAISSQISQVSL